MKGDWITLAHDVCPVAMFGPDSCNSLFESSINAFELITPADLIAKEDALTIVRMVGEIEPLVHVSSTATTGGSAIIWMGYDEAILTMTTDDTGGVKIPDPRATGFFERDTILWQRRTVFGGAFAPLSDTALDLDSQWGPLSAHLDIRVKRKLKQGEVLAYVSAAWVFAETGGSDFTITIHQSHHLRGYVKF